MAPATSWIHGNYWLNKFLTPCIQAGLLNLVDGVSVHPYQGGNPPENAVADYTGIRSVMQTYGGKTVPIISSEWGYSTVPGTLPEQTNVVSTGANSRRLHGTDALGQLQPGYSTLHSVSMGGRRSNHAADRL